MAADYRRIYPAIWRETLGWTDDERTVLFYLLTCRHMNTEGLYELPTAYACADLGWDADRFDTALAAVAVRGWAVRDGDLVLVPKALAMQPPSSPNTLKGARRAVAGIPRDSTTYAAFFDLAAEICPDLADLLDQPLRRGFEAPSKQGQPRPPVEVLASGLRGANSPLPASSSSSPSSSSSSSTDRGATGSSPPAARGTYPFLDPVDQVAAVVADRFPDSPFPAAWASSRQKAGALLTLQGPEVRTVVIDWLREEAPKWQTDVVNVKPTIGWAVKTVRENSSRPAGGHRPPTPAEMAAGEARMAALDDEDDDAQGVAA